MTTLIAIARATVLAGFVSGCIALSAPALAADTDSDAAPHAAISLRGADLTSPRDVARLKRELRHVATGMCTPHSSGQIFMTRDQQKCYDTAVRNGLAQIDSRQQQAMRQQAVRLADTRANGNAVD